MKHGVFCNGHAIENPILKALATGGGLLLGGVFAAIVTFLALVLATLTTALSAGFAILCLVALGVLLPAMILTFMFAMAAIVPLGILREAWQERSHATQV